MLTFRINLFKKILFFHYKATTVLIMQNWVKIIKFSIIKFKNQLRFWINLNILKIIK